MRGEGERGRRGNEEGEKGGSEEGKRGGRVRRGREKGRTLFGYVHTKGHSLFLSGRTDKAFSIPGT